MQPQAPTFTGRKRERLAIVGLSLLGLADSLYMLAYHQRVLDSLACPAFGQGCNVVGRSAPARHFGVPNAAVGALAYATMAVLAIWPGDRPPERRSLQAATLRAVSIGAFISSVLLTWEQAVRVKAWCFWCLLSAAINLAIIPLALSNRLKGHKKVSSRSTRNYPLRYPRVCSATRTRWSSVVPSTIWKNLASRK